ncbi:O-acyltransferase [Bordetella trematum]|nr:O-acyltransferase [Bordetella trematum]
MQIILAQPYMPGLVRQQVAARYPDASWLELPSADMLGPNPSDIASLDPASHDCLLFGDGMFANSTRIALFARLKALGCVLHALVFDHALVCPDARIGIGSLVYPHAILDEGCLWGSTSSSARAR